MASQTPVFIHDENLHIHGGKGAGVLKSGLPRTKSVKPGLQERKTLRDLSIAKHTQPPGPSKAMAVLKETSALKSGASKVKKAAVKGSALTDQELEKCREWAKEGIECCRCKGYDMQKLEERFMKEDVYIFWTSSDCDLGMPKIAEDTEDDLKLDLEPEILPPTINDGWNSGIEDDMDDLPEADIVDIDDIGDITMKEEYA